MIRFSDAPIPGEPKRLEADGIDGMRYP